MINNTIQKKYFVNIVDSFYNNIPLVEINNKKQLINDIKNLKVKDITHKILKNINCIFIL